VIPRLVLGSLLLGACGASPAPPPELPPEHVMTTPELAPPIALTLGMLSLRSSAASAESAPMTAEMVDDAGHLTATRCGATSLSADGILRRDDEIVVRFEPAADGFLLRDGTGRDTHLVLRADRIETASGELRFRRDGSSIVSPDSEVPSVEITPPSANLDTALALFATLLVCDDLGP
jgi:hypothetical protein